MNKLRQALRAQYGARCYRITRTGDVHVYGQMPNSNVMGWHLLGDIEFAKWRMSV
jgi:hypothetical protein